MHFLFIDTTIKLSLKHIKQKYLNDEYLKKYILKKGKLYSHTKKKEFEKFSAESHKKDIKL